MTSARHALVGAFVVLLSLSTGCAAGPVPTASPDPAAPRPSVSAILSPPSVTSQQATGTTQIPPTTMSLATSAGGATTTPAPIRQGTAAPSSRIRFVPRQIQLPSGNSADVEPEPTVAGVLQIPSDVQHVGWWDGSSAAGDPFGSTVIAGHVDNREQGLGFFAELLLVQTGDLISLRSGAAALTYRVVSTTLVDKQALASDSQALDQRGPHRLVLVTCSGTWHPEIRSYDSNLIVVAVPVDS